MKGQPLFKYSHWLTPLSWLYGLGVSLRNQLFDAGILKEHSFRLPVICIGNLTIGGTGKTPHTEYLIRLLQKDHQVAVLSRGYKRKSKGFVLATPNTPMPIIGDEPYQMKQKFPNIHVAVDANRCRGINQLMQPDIHPQTEVILLDDAFQHRYVKAGLNILLTDYNRPITQDSLLPAGSLREPLNGKDRAQIIIVTKCPNTLSPMDCRVLNKTLTPYPYQNLFFTTLEYGDLTPLFCTSAPPLSLNVLQPEDRVLLITGIAYPTQLIRDLNRYTSHLTSLCYPDHHRFTTQDAHRISATFQKLSGTGRRLILTTEKDATRLQPLTTLSPEVRNALYTLPIQVRFLHEGAREFNKIITEFVG